MSISMMLRNIQMLVLKFSLKAFLLFIVNWVFKLWWHGKLCCNNNICIYFNAQDAIQG